MTEIKNTIDNLLAKLNLRFFYNSLKLLKIFQIDYGHLKSANTRESVNNQGAIPWFTYPAIEFLDQLDLRDKNIFEYGSGNSTLYWTKKCKHVTSVEDDEIWYKNIKKNINSYKTKLIFVKDQKAYINSIKKSDGEFDIIVIDGSFRYSCTKSAIKSLTKGGMVIIDNSDQYPEACNYLRSKEFKQVDFFGFGPINPHTWCTSIFLTRDYNFKSLSEKQPRYAIGGIKKIARS